MSLEADRARLLVPSSAAAALAAGQAAAAQRDVKSARTLLAQAAKLGGKSSAGAEARRALARLKQR